MHKAKKLKVPVKKTKKKNSKNFLNNVKIGKNLSKEIIDKVIKISKIQSEMTLKTSIRFKMVYKAAYDFFNNKLMLIKKKESEKDVMIRQSLYPFFKKMVGAGRIVEKRMKEILISSFNYRSSKKIQFFLRFLGLLEEGEYFLAEEKFYLAALDGVKKLKTGFNIPTNLEKGNHYIPYIRALDYLDISMKEKLGDGEMKQLRTVLQKKKKRDVRYGNKDGMIDFDEFAFQTLVAYRALINGKSGKG